MTFQTTMWSLIREARDRGGPALDDLVRRYWEPIRGFLQSRGFNAAESEDLAQEVLLEVCREEFLVRADAKKGRFRSLLLAVARNLSSKHVRGEKAVKRGGDIKRVPLHDNVAVEPDEEYNRYWAVQLARRALDRLRDLNPDFAGAIESHYFDGLPYRTIAEKLGRKEHDVKNYIYQGKQRLKEFIEESVREYCSSAEEYREELADLSQYLP